MQFCTQEELRVQLQKMEAGASDHETVAVSWLSKCLGFFHGALLRGLTVKVFQETQ